MNTSIIGLVGEIQACQVITQSKAGANLKYISNFPVKDQKGQYFQVDTLVVCSKGIFCIEVKNWEATVHCSDKYYWQVEYSSGEKKVRSPLVQNRQHCNKVQTICGKHVMSIILFTDSASLLSPVANVMYVSDFINYLAVQPIRLGEDEVENIYQGLVAYKKSIEPEMLVDFVFKNLI